MNARDLLALVLGALRGHGRRTGLTLLGVAIGVAAVLLLTALGEGARRYVRGEFAELGSNLVGVVPGKSETSGAIPGLTGGVPNDLTIADAHALHRSLPDAEYIVPLSLGSADVAHGERSRDAIVLGCTPDIIPLRNLAVRAGKPLPDLPWERGAPVAIIGSLVAAELFPGRSAVGLVLRLGGWRMRVVGVLEPKGMHLGLDFDKIVLVPVATCMAMFDKHSLFRIAVRMRPGADMDWAQRRVAAVLEERHGEEDFTLITQDAVLGALGDILDTLTLVLAGIAAVSLAVAGLGVMNVMLVSVSERTPEVGLLKAVGAAPGQVLGMFLAEAVVITTAGGLVGLGLGAGLVQMLVVLWPVFPAAVPGWAVLSALGVSMFVGIVFGVLPARRAMQLDPVAALARR